MTNKIILKKRTTVVSLSPTTTTPTTTTPTTTKVILKSRNSDASNAQPRLQPQETKPVIKMIRKTVIPIAESDTMAIDLNDSELAVVLKNNRKDLTKEEIIEQMESQRATLVKNQTQYSPSDYQYKLQTIDALLSKYKVGWIQSNVTEMQTTRTKIDQIILNKKISNDQFKTQTDLTGENDHQDPHTMVVVGGRTFFEKHRNYQPIPKELEKKNPANEKNRMFGFGNHPLPPDLRRLIDFM